MKIGVLADTHIPENSKDIPPGILEAFKDAEMIIHAGDLGCLEVAERLLRVCPRLEAVHGNMDSPQLKERFPEKRILKIARFSIGITHGFGPPNKLIEFIGNIFKNDKLDMVIFGHSHTAFNQKVNNVLYFNPGSPTDKIFAPYNSYGIINITDKIEARIIEL